jgi:hypothetical protein
VRSGPGEARTILLLHIISVRPSKNPIMVWYVPSSRYIWSSAPIFFLQEQIEDIIILMIIINVSITLPRAGPNGRISERNPKPTETDL